MNYKIKNTIKRKIIISYFIDYYTKHFTNKNKYNFAVLSNDFIGRQLITRDFFEEDYLNLISKFISVNKIKIRNVLDIGANIGNHSIFFSKFSEMVYSFEPSTKAFELLKINVKNKNIKIFKYGLSDRKYKGILTESRFNLGGSNIINKIEKHHFFNEKIKLFKLDDLKFLKDKKIDLIKIDIEGHEIKAVKGSIKIIKKNSPLIIFELIKTDINKNSSKVINLLSKLNYEFYEIKGYPYEHDNKFRKLLNIFIHLIYPKKIYFKKINNNKLESTKNYPLILAINKNKKN
jgi:FkbM family methyltransferase